MWWKTFAKKHNIEYRLWSDEDLDTFVKTHYPEFNECCYSKYPKRIQKVDAARYMILHRHGGLYADMDFEICNDNLLNDIHPIKSSIVESPYKHNEYYHNSLMVSPQKRDPFWLHVLDTMRDPKRLHSRGILYSTGPQMLDAAIYSCNVREDGQCIHMLPSNTYQPPYLPFQKEGLCQQYKRANTIHHLTNSY